MLGASLIGREELKELEDVVLEQSPYRHYGIGHPQKVASLEREIAALMNVKYALAVSSGSAALHCAMTSLGIGPGDEVIVPAFGWYSDYYAAACAGALPVFADIDEGLNLDPADFERKITPRTKAVIVIHYQGCPARMDEIMRIARAHSIKVVEDCAQAFGGLWQGRPLGTIGDIGVVSFQTNKVITAGEGGALVTNHEPYFARAVRYHDLGLMRPVFARQLNDTSLAEPEQSFAGMQFRMGELQGAFLLAQLRKLPVILDRCRTGWTRIRNALAQGPFTLRPFVDSDCGFTLFLRFPDAGEASRFADALKAEGIPAGPTSSCCVLPDQYPIKSRKMYRDDLPPFAPGFNGEHAVYDSAADTPNTNRLLGEYVAIPIGALYGDAEYEDIIAAVTKVASGLRRPAGS